jgi:carboxymethylenebutenolidase
VATANKDIPPAEGDAKAVLQASPRHGEYVDVKVAGGTAVKTWVSYPERKDKAPVVIVIHEIFGLSDWIRSVADRLAADGFIALAPDLISGKGPGGGGTAGPERRRRLLRDGASRGTTRGHPGSGARSLR